MGVYGFIEVWVITESTVFLFAPLSVLRLPRQFFGCLFGLNIILRNSQSIGIILSFLYHTRALEEYQC